MLLTALALALAGCGPGGAWAVAVVLLAIAAAGCAVAREPPDATAGDGGLDAPAIDDAGCRVPVECCSFDRPGLLTSCCCDVDTSCNYGLDLVVCDDRVHCGYAWQGTREQICGAHDDAGSRDAGGAWEPCCDDATGTISSCFCPAGVACNYGMYVSCPDGSCANGPSCPDAG